MTAEIRELDLARIESANISTRAKASEQTGDGDWTPDFRRYLQTSDPVETRRLTERLERSLGNRGS